MVSKKEKNYRIFRVEECKNRIVPKKITMSKICAKDDSDAYDQLKEYIRLANKQYKYYVEPINLCQVIEDGKKVQYEDCFEMWEAQKKARKWYQAMYDNISLTLWKYFVRIPKDCYYWCRDLVYLVKNKQQYCASWCIDDMMLDTLVFNIPILKKYKHTLSWKMLDKAILEKNKNLKKEDLEEYHRKHPEGYGKEIEDRAVELEYQMFDQLVEDIKTYRYYMDDFMYIDKKNKELVELDKKLRPTLPLIKGSYDRYDYRKLNSLVEKYWNRIWDTVRVYGREFND